MLVVQWLPSLILSLNIGENWNSNPWGRCWGKRTRRGREGENKLIIESLTLQYVSTKTHGFVTLKKKTGSRNKGNKDNQGCALAEPIGPWHPTFALGQIENLRFFIQIICWAPWILLVQSTGLPSIFLRAQHWTNIERELIWCFFFISWFWSGSCFWLSLQTHDTCSGNPVVPCTGTPARIQSTNYSCRHVGCWLHIWRTAR